MSDTSDRLRNGTDTRPDATGPAFRIDRASFLKIAAVEGLSPTAEADDRAREFDRSNLSPQQRRDAIIEAYRPKG